MPGIGVSSPFASAGRLDVCIQQAKTHPRADLNGASSALNCHIGWLRLATVLVDGAAPALRTLRLLH